MNPQDKRWQIHRHLAQDTDERLQIVRNAPKRILLVGADADISRSLLAARYPNAVFEEYDPRADFLQTTFACGCGGLEEIGTRGCRGLCAGRVSGRVSARCPPRKVRIRLRSTRPFPCESSL